MTNFLQTAFENSFFISVLIVIFALIVNLVEKRYSARFRYWVWLVLAVRLLLPFDITLPRVKPIVIPVPEIVVYSGVKIDNFVSDTLLGNKGMKDENIIANNTKDNINGDSSDLSKNNITSGLQQKPMRLTLTDVLMQAWIVGAILSLSFYMLQYLVTRRSLLRMSAIAADKQEVMERIKKELGIPQKVKIALKYCDGVQSPVLMGAVRPMILLPNAEYKVGELEMVLRHELVHFKQRDIWYKFFMVLCVACYWYNPCVYLMQELSERDMEISCDSKVIDGRDKQFVESYIASLMETIRFKKSKSMALTTSFGTDKETMKKRMKNIFDTSKKHKGIVALTFAIVLAIGAGTMVACTATNNEPTITALPKIEIPQEVMELVMLNENHNFGNTDVASDGTISYGFIFLCNKNLIEEFKTSYDVAFPTYKIPYDVEHEVRNFLYVNELPYEPDKHISPSYPEDYGQYWDIEKFKIEQIVSSQEENGDISVTFLREYDGKILNNVEYVFQKNIAKNIPEILQGIYTEGQEYYRIKEITSIVSQSLEEPKLL